MDCSKPKSGQLCCESSRQSCPRYPRGSPRVRSIDLRSFVLALPISQMWALTRLVVQRDVFLLYGFCDSPPGKGYPHVLSPSGKTTCSVKCVVLLLFLVSQYGTA